jgi:hypothetical protein
MVNKNKNFEYTAMIYTETKSKILIVSTILRNRAQFNIQKSCQVICDDTSILILLILILLINLS